MTSGTVTVRVEAADDFDAIDEFGFEPAAAHGITGDYGAHDGWMVRSLGSAIMPTGHVRYCSSFLE